MDGTPVRIGNLRAGCPHAGRRDHGGRYHRANSSSPEASRIRPHVLSSRGEVRADQPRRLLRVSSGVVLAHVPPPHRLHKRRSGYTPFPRCSTHFLRSYSSVCAATSTESADPVTLMDMLNAITYHSTLHQVQVQLRCSAAITQDRPRLSIDRASDGCMRNAVEDAISLSHPSPHDSTNANAVKPYRDFVLSAPPCDLSITPPNPLLQDHRRSA